MTEKNQKTALWEDELPNEIKAVMAEAFIDAIIQNFNKTNDPYCIALLCDQINAVDHETKPLDIIRLFAQRYRYKCRPCYRKRMRIE